MFEFGLARLCVVGVGQVTGEAGGVVDLDQEFCQWHLWQAGRELFAVFDDVGGDCFCWEALKADPALVIDRHGRVGIGEQFFEIVEKPAGVGLDSGQLFVEGFGSACLGERFRAIVGPGIDWDEVGGGVGVAA